MAGNRDGRPKLTAGFSRRLLGWYDRNRRDLPWRAAPGERADPYHVWLSEVMLQQTRVDTVRPYFLRWLERFPSLEALAEADQDEVLKAWEGLGYYSRARNFHRAVREVVAEYGGRVPDDPAEFRALPGVGRYTAGAVQSIAFGRREAVVDGNVRRVLARLLDDPDPSEPTLWAAAAELVPADRPGDFNQALMELGATVCTPRRPLCADCPVHELCRAHAAGTAAERPARKPRAPRRIEVHGVAVVEGDGRMLLVRRPVEGRLGGLWEFPGLATAAGEESAEAAAIRAARELGGAEVDRPVPLGRVRHVFTHVTVDYVAYRARALGTAADRRDRSWVRREEIPRYSLPAAQHRILALLDASRDQTGTGGTRQDTEENLKLTDVRRP